MRAEGGGKFRGFGMSGFFSSLIPHPSSLAAGMMMAAACLMANTVWAQTVNDPTRPPAGFDSGVADASVGAVGPTLQSVLISPTQKAAIIGGVTVRLGEKYGDAVLVKVAENEVVLRNGTVLQVLKLYPGVEKRELVPAANKGAQHGARAATQGVPAR